MKYIPFGDSHSIFWSNRDDFPNLIPNDDEIQQIFWLGPAKIWGLKNSTQNKTKEKYETFIHIVNNFEKIVPVACFGEIDIRVNLIRNVLSQRSFDAIEQIVDVYLSQLSRLSTELTIIWGPGPSKTDSSQDLLNVYNCFGTEYSRNALTHLFNKAILNKINNYTNLKFATLFYDLIDNALHAKKNALRDGLHLSNTNFATAKAMLNKLVRSDTKAILNLNVFRQMPEFEIYENRTPISKNVYQLYKFFGEHNFEVYLSGIDYEWGNFSTIDIRSKSTLELKKNDPINEIEFIYRYFSSANINTLRAYTNYVLLRLKGKNQRDGDANPWSTTFDLEFAKNYFNILAQQIMSTNYSIEVNSLLQKIDSIGPNKIIDFNDNPPMR